MFFSGHVHVGLFSSLPPLGVYSCKVYTILAICKGCKTKVGSSIQFLGCLLFLLQCQMRLLCPGLSPFLHSWQVPQVVLPCSEISVSQGKACGSGSTTNTTAASTPNTVSSTKKPIAGLVLGGGLPAIPSDILKRIQSKSYMELSELLPERIQESFLYPDGKKKKAPAIDKFVNWVLAFCTYSQALLSVNSSIGGELLTFVGTVARLARDHPGLAWATYERAFRANVVADPSIKWNKLDQEVWALNTVKAAQPVQSSQLPQKRRAPNSATCDRWNEGTFCPFKACKFNHACSTCLSPQHRASACPSGQKDTTGSASHAVKKGPTAQ